MDTLDLQWSTLRVGVLLSCCGALRQTNLWTSALAALGLLAWTSWDLSRALRRQREAFWQQVAVPLRVCAYAEQLGEKIEPGSEKAWGPLRLWQLSAPGVRHVLRPDFSQAQGALRFRALQQKVQCLFAAKAKVWGNDWCEGSGETAAALAVNVQQTLPRLLRFCLEVKLGKPLDGFVFEIRGRDYCRDLQSFARSVRQVLCGFSAADPSGANCMAKIQRRGWYFQFAREPLFVTTFAPCYARSNPRYQFELHPDSCFILFQPEESFLRHELPPDKPRGETNWEQPSDVRDRIRVNFQRAGREYRIPETTSYPPADFIVAAHDVLKDPSVQFWEG